MKDFFSNGLNEYNQHIINNVKRCKEGYRQLALQIPKSIHRFFDLGCGAGLELKEIFKIYPHIEVIGIDMTKSMLDKLTQKY